MDKLPLTYVSQESMPDCSCPTVNMSDSNVSRTTSFNNHYATYDRSNLNIIDPDINYLSDANNNVTSNYYDENGFNAKFHNNNNLSLIHLNIRSVPLHFSEFLSYLDTLDIHFKIIALSETAININHITYNIPSYRLEMHHRLKRKGGGVSLYIHDSLQYKTRTDLEIGGEVNSVFIEIPKSSLNTKYNVLCGCVYRPPSMSLKVFNELWTQLLDKLQHESKLHIYITGDFNVNVLPDIKSSLHAQDFKNLLSSNFFTPLITKPTRITAHSATLIDNIYSNVAKPANNCVSGILRVSISDHFAIFCISKNVILPVRNSSMKKRSFSDKYVHNFNCRLIKESWDFIYTHDTQDAFTRFQGVFDQHFNSSFKMQTYAMNYKNRHPWMTKALRSQIKMKNRMHSEALENNDYTLFDEYKIVNNSLKSLLRNAEIQYYSDQLELHKNDLSKSWKVLKNIIGRDNNKSKNSLTFCIENRTISDSTEIANSFNNFFVTIGPQLAEKINSTISPMSYVTYVPNSIVIFDVTCTEVKQVISSLKNSSAGWDDIPTSIAKKCIDNFIEPLTYLINSSLSEGIFPMELKLARVVPIFKAGDPSRITNYRPISVLSFFSRVFEKIMYNHVLNFMNKNNIIYEHQYGFRQKHSTQQAIITLVDRITHSLDKGDIVISVFLDLKKAFDTVDHNILLKKLYAYGIRGNYYNWFKSYLSDRSQYVVYDDKQSDTHHIKCGVPQGSILGPLLFIIYMNDICNVSQFLMTILYADDTSVSLSANDLNSLIDQLTIELELLTTWLKSNKLSLNAQKTFYLLFHRGRIKSCDISIIMDNCALNRINNIKYLGVIIDHKLNWCEHIAYVKNKVSKGVGIIYKARRVLSKKSLVNLYHSYIFPYLIYCIEVWGCAAKTHLHPLFLTQKKIVRLITFSPYLAHTEPIFHNLLILPLDKLIFHRIGILMYKLSNGMLPEVLNRLYKKNSEIHSYNTRNCNLLRIPKGTLNFTNVSARLWNTIILNINVNTSFSTFKHSLKIYLLNNNIKLKYTN